LRPSVCIIVLALLLLFCGGSYAQNDEAAPGPSVFRGHAGLIINRSYSNIDNKEEIIDDFTRITKTRSDSAPAVKAGFFFGGEALLGKNEKFMGAFALSFVKSGAEYHFSYLEEGPTNSRVGYNYMKRSTELQYKESYFYLDIHAGARNQLFKNVFLTTGLVFSKPMVTQSENRGYVLTTYSATGSPETESTVAYLSTPRQKVKGASNLSFRLRVEYQFSIGESKMCAYVFRNFGMIYTLPWWGFGTAYSF
jgi:hypothetical protein